MLFYDLLLSQNMVWRLTHILVQIVTLILINIQYFTYEHTIKYLFILLFMDSCVVSGFFLITVNAATNIVVHLLENLHMYFCCVNLWE